MPGVNQTQLDWIVLHNYYLLIKILDPTAFKILCNWKGWRGRGEIQENTNHPAQAPEARWQSKAYTHHSLRILCKQICHRHEWAWGGCTESKLQLLAAMFGKEMRETCSKHFLFATHFNMIYNRIYTRSFSTALSKKVSPRYSFNAIIMAPSWLFWLYSMNTSDLHWLVIPDKCCILL